MLRLSRIDVDNYLWYSYVAGSTGNECPAFRRDAPNRQPTESASSVRRDLCNDR